MKETMDLSSPELRGKDIPAVDIGKFICAILVVAMHCNPFEDFHPWLSFALVHGLARIAVPFFFVCSGYFCVRKACAEGFDPKICYRYAWKLLKLYGIWLGVYGIQIVYQALSDEGGIAAGALSGLHLLLASGYGHLWYLKSLAVAIALVALALSKNIKIKTILFFAAGFYMVGLLGDSYYGLLGCVPGLRKIMDWYLKIFLTTRNGLFEGFLFVAIGALFARRPVVMKPWLASMGFIVCTALMIAEAFLVRGFALALDYNMYIFLVPASFFLFYALASVDMKASSFTGKLRLYSTWVYYIHPWIIFPVLSVITMGLSRVLGWPDDTMPSLLQFAIVLLGSFLATFLIVRLQKCKGFSWLKKLGG